MPKPLQPYEAQIGKFLEDCHALCNRILKLFAIALKVREATDGPDEDIDDRLEDSRLGWR